MLVAPLAGAWIETLRVGVDDKVVIVAPLAGAWIETTEANTRITGTKSSLPSRERGLKPKYRMRMRMATLVAPLAGAWIETSYH